MTLFTLWFAFALLAALAFFISLAGKNNRKVLEQNEEIRKLRERKRETQRLPLKTPKSLPKRFVSVIFNYEGSRIYDYLIYYYFFDENKLSLRINDFVEVPYDNGYAIAKVTYVSFPGEKSNSAHSAVIRKVSYSPQKNREIIIEKPVYIPQPVREIKQPHVTVFKPVSTPITSSPQKMFPSAERFVSVLFPRCSREYHYLMGKVTDLKIGDIVLVPIHKKFKKDELMLANELGLKIRETTCLPAIVKYISRPGEVSEYARSEVIKKVNNSSNFNFQPNKRFVSVIFKKGGRKRYDYFVGDNQDLKVDDFVVVPVYENNPDKFDLKIVKIKYVGAYGEISTRAHSTVIGKINKRVW